MPLPKPSQLAVLYRLRKGARLRRVERMFLGGPMPQKFTDEPCVVRGTDITHLIAEGWVEDRSTPEERAQGIAVYHISAAGRAAIDRWEDQYDQADAERRRRAHVPPPVVPRRTAPTPSHRRVDPV